VLLLFVFRISGRFLQFAMILRSDVDTHIILAGCRRGRTGRRRCWTARPSRTAWSGSNLRLLRFWWRRRRERTLINQLFDLLQIQRLFLQQRLRDQVHFILVLLQDLATLLVALVDHALHLLIDLVGDLIGVILLMSQVAAEE